MAFVFQTADDSGPVKTCRAIVSIVLIGQIELRFDLSVRNLCAGKGSVADKSPIAKTREREDASLDRLFCRIAQCAT